MQQNNTEEIIQQENTELPENAEQKDTAPAKKKRGFFAELYDWAETFCVALALMMVLFVFVFRYVTVDGDSMKNTLMHDDKLIISHLNYTPAQGDIVVVNVKSDNVPYIKRIIAVGGQRVRIDFENWQVYVDGVPLEEEYVKREPGAMHHYDCTEEEFTVKEGYVFVMGDNRNNSRDSRDITVGQIEEHNIIGRVIIRVAPFFGVVE